MLVQRTASVRGVTSLAPAMLTTKVADANLRSVMTSPCRPPFDIKAALIGTMLSVSLCAPASLSCEWDSVLAPCS